MTKKRESQMRNNPDDIANQFINFIKRIKKVRKTN